MTTDGTISNSNVTHSEAIERVKVTRCDCKFKNDKKANVLLRLADEFLDTHRDIIYWTERNSTKRGSFYRYHEGTYQEVSILEIEKMLVDIVPSDNSITLPSSLSQSKLSETINIIMRRRFFYRDHFNPDGIINFKNGLYSLEDDILTKHTKHIISTNKLPYDYDKNAECPNFLWVLQEATGGDQVKKDIIQEFAGYCLTRDTRLEKILFLIGAIS